MGRCTLEFVLANGGQRSQVRESQSTAARLRGISVHWCGAEEEERASTDETKLILFALGSQATQGSQQAAAARGECKQLGWFGGGGADAVETAKLTTWKNLGNLDKFEAMRLCVHVFPPSP
jgi:hypothetical protein